MANPKWQKGILSPNPGGRPKESKIIAELAREKCPRMIELLAEIAEDPGAPQSARVSAINSILDRGLGRAPQEVNLSGDMGLNLSDLSDAEIASALVSESIKAFRAGELDPDSFLSLIKIGPEIDGVPEIDVVN